MAISGETVYLGELSRSYVSRRTDEVCFIAGKMHQRWVHYIEYPTGQMTDVKYEWEPVPYFDSIEEANAS